MLRKCCVVVALAAAVILAACGAGPMEPMPGEPDMLILGGVADTVIR